MEYCSRGNLRDFLRNNRPSLLEVTGDMEPLLTFRDLLSSAYQITRGMSYLSSKKVLKFFIIIYDHNIKGTYNSCTV